MDTSREPSDLVAEVTALRRSRDEALRAARAAVRDASRVNRLLTVLNEPAPIDSLLDSILNTISEIFSADVVVLMDTAGTGHFYPVASVGLPEDFAFREASLGDIAPLFEQKWEGGVLTPEMIQATPVFAELGQLLQIQAAAWIPMKNDRALRGALALGRCAAQRFTPDEIGLLSTMAYRIAVALEQQQQKQQLERIIRGDREIGDHHLEASAIMDAAVHAFPAIVGADAAVLLRCADDYAMVCHSGSRRINADATDWPHLARELSAMTAIQAGATLSLRFGGDTRLSALSPDFPYAVALAAPVMCDGRLQNLICAFRVHALEFPAEATPMAALYAGKLATALENAHLYGALRRELQERIAAEASLRESEERFKALVRNISDVITVLDADGRIKYAGNAARALWGRAPQAFVGTRLLDRAHPDDFVTLAAVIADAQKHPGKNFRVVARMRDGEGEAWRFFDVIVTNLLHEAAVSGIVATFHDITERKIHEETLSELAFRDPLTGLANRANFCDRVRFALARADERQASVVMIFFDLDNFKSVNDTFGHTAGDLTLRTVADRVLGCLRSNDMAARLGGDEFTILIEHIKDIDHSLPVIERLQLALMEPIRLNGVDVTVGGSIGVAISVPNKDNVESLLYKADQAMYRAKRSGKGRYVFFTPEAADD